ncbi:hypothetical protein NYD60_22015 [Burkholderia thailandensis]|nr:hypothetical protein [Burkholderia thailandensis]MCS3399634.1 hypothetical protein [Burkholderia thailandensis]MCS6472124.1 hypothetical protein [Burkholderia thailandensis]MCS6479260.1 hypothetical protein [Burkholderia thailandensis]MCS6496901.1 hypothetical protein [Burkholderia thailandensis]MCS6502664.1 hypothetical protein [Burkholderia thailandensis]
MKSIRGAGRQKGRSPRHAPCDYVEYVEYSLRPIPRARPFWRPAQARYQREQALDERDALRHEKHRRLLSAMRAARRASKRRASRADRPSRIGKFRSRSASARRIGDAEQSIGTHFESTSRNATSGHFIERSAQC